LFLNRIIIVIIKENYKNAWTKSTEYLRELENFNEKYEKTLMEINLYKEKMNNLNALASENEV